MKLLLTGVAALLLATGTAHANDLLPESVLGRWCHDGNISNKSEELKFIFVLVLNVIGAVVMISLMVSP